MNDFPKVSILVPVYNRERLIYETLNSGINQTYKNIELIVVDNKSTDNTYGIITEFAKSYPNVKTYQNEANIGPVKNWSKCLAYAKGEYVKILWSDDLIAPTFTEKALPYLIHYEDVAFVFTGTEIFNDNTGQKTKAYFIGDTGIYDTRTFIEGCLIGGPFPLSPGNALFRKKDLEKNLLLDIPNKIGSDFKMHAVGNDVLIYLLIARDYPKFAFINETLSHFRYHSDSISISLNKANLSFLYSLAEAYFVENYVQDEQLKTKFNAKLLAVSLRHGWKKNAIIRSLKDYYFAECSIKVDWRFFASLIMNKIFQRQNRNAINNS